METNKIRTPSDLKDQSRVENQDSVSPAGRLDLFLWISRNSLTRRDMRETLAHLMCVMNNRGHAQFGKLRVEDADTLLEANL